MKEVNTRLNSEQEEFVARYYEKMFQMLMSYARAALNDESRAEEAVQDTFRIACVKVEDFMTSENPNGWLVLALKYVINNMRRNLATINKMVVSTLSMEQQQFMDYGAVQVDTHRRLEDENIDILYSDLLSSDEYELLKLVALHNYTMREAAKVFNIDIEVCKKRVQRAKLKLQKIFEKDF